MVGANVKAETKELIDRRSGLEQEMNVIIARLSAGPNGPGLTGNLLDSHGFPRADIDIPAVRSDRNRLAMLRNDHKNITAKIEQNLHILLSGGLGQDHQTLPQKRSAEGEELGLQISSGSSSISSISLFHPSFCAPFISMASVDAFQEIAFTSGSYSAMTNKTPCDVFINHRGPDVKYKLASQIYYALDAIGLRPFLDEEVLEPGVAIHSAIQKAMSSASLHIAILSPNYAQSSWCLDELSFMLRTGTKIIPIFYHVAPSDARWVIQGKGIYADSFYEHEKKGRVKSEKIEEWKRALYDVSLLSGHLVNDDKAEARMLKSICNEALQSRNGFRVKIAKFLIRSDEHMDRLLPDTDEESDDSEDDVEEALIECSDEIMSLLADRVEGSLSRCLDRVEVSVTKCVNKVEGSLSRCLDRVEVSVTKCVNKVEGCVDKVEGSVTKCVDQVEESGDEPIEELFERGLKKVFGWLTEE